MLMKPIVHLEEGKVVERLEEEVLPCTQLSHNFLYDHLATHDACVGRGGGGLCSCVGLQQSITLFKNAEQVMNVGSVAWLKPY